LIGRVTYASYNGNGGKSRSSVKDGKVVDVGEYEVEWCPLFAKLRGVQKITPEEVKKTWNSGSAI
jgi:hypothetical protein